MVTEMEIWLDDGKRRGEKLSAYLDRLETRHKETQLRIHKAEKRVKALEAKLTEKPESEQVEENDCPVCRDQVKWQYDHCGACGKTAEGEPLDLDFKGTQGERVSKAKLPENPESEKVEEDALKSCPFCGGDAGLVDWPSGDVIDFSKRVECLSGDCEATCWSENKQTAIQSWNRRAGGGS